MLYAATRGSELARWQANYVAGLLRLRSRRDVEAVIVSTVGDRDKITPLHEIGGKGVFVKEVQAAVLDGRAHFAVHSAKDLPALTPDGLVIAAVPQRADPRDVLVGATLASLGEGSTVGTGSVRRRVQVLEQVDGVVVTELRGNIATRLAKVGELDAVVMAAAALERLNRWPEVYEVLEPEVMLPQVGQGALAIECRADDEETLAALAEIDDPVAHRCLDAERAFLMELGGDCDLPAGAFAEADSLDGDIRVRAMLSDGDRVVHRSEATGADGQRLGRELAIELRDRLQ